MVGSDFTASSEISALGDLPFELDGNEQAILEQLNQFQQMLESMNNLGLVIPWRDISDLRQKLSEAMNDDTISADLVQALASKAVMRTPTVIETTHIDPLTGLPNKRYFEETYDRTIESLRREEISAVYILFFDQDGLKFINDQYNHVVGDHYIKTFGQGINTISRSNEFVARFGDSSDEFGIIVTVPALEAGAEFNEEEFKSALETRYKKAIDHDERFVFQVNETDAYRTTAGFGLHKVDENLSLEDNLAIVDQAMTQAKEASGKPRGAAPLRVACSSIGSPENEMP